MSLLSLFSNYQFFFRNKTIVASFLWILLEPVKKKNENQYSVGKKKIEYLPA
jgi:hypothetical protein